LKQVQNPKRSWDECEKREGEKPREEKENGTNEKKRSVPRAKKRPSFLFTF